MTRCIIEQQRPGLWITIFGSNTTDPGHQTLQNFEIKCASNSLASSNEFPANSSFPIKECNEDCSNWPSFTIIVIYNLSLPSQNRLCHRKTFRLLKKSSQCTCCINQDVSDALLPSFLWNLITALCSMLVFQHRQKSCFGWTVIILLFINRLKQNLYYRKEECHSF